MCATDWKTALRNRKPKSKFKGLSSAWKSIGLKAQVKLEKKLEITGVKHVVVVPGIPFFDYESPFPTSVFRQCRVFFR